MEARNWAAIRGWVGLVVRLALAGIWAWAAVSKIGSPRTFVQAVRAYHATPEWLAKAIGYGLPVLELSLALLLVAGLIVRYAATVSALLFLVFIIGIAQASIRGIKIECGCFGGGGDTTSTAYTLDILRDVGLLVLAAYLIIWPMTKLSMDAAIIKTEMVPGLTSKQSRSEKNLRRYRAAMAAAEVELKHKQRYVAIGTLVVVALVAVIAIGVQGGRAKITGTVDLANASATTGVRVGNQAAPVKVDIYEDFQCPICNELEQSGLTKDFDAKIKATNIKVNYHVESFLDSASNGNNYSSRAANAGYCASDISPEVFLKFHDIVYGKDASGANNQPAEGSSGRPDSTLLAWGKQAGATTSDFTNCVTSNSHANLVQAVTEAASKAGVTGTPTVFVNDKKIGSDSSVPTLAQIDAAIASALASSKSTVAPSPTPSVTGSGSGSASVAPSVTASSGE
ncbi:MAG: DoxX family rane protein [Frankiales bacterium]|nr:DoxX family rane protein [Frankiales bacterium]